MMSKRLPERPEHAVDCPLGSASSANVSITWSVTFELLKPIMSTIGHSVIVDRVQLTRFFFFFFFVEELTPGVEAALAGPLAEPGVCLGLVHRALVETRLEQEVERLPHHPARLDAEELHHLPAVERRRIESSSSCSRSSAIRASSSSIRRASARARFLFRVVQSHRCRWLRSASNGPASRT